MRKPVWMIGLIVGVSLVLLTQPVTAGSSADPEITDVAGDANFVNSQGGVLPIDPEGPDTRPASFDNVDLRAVWFETAYTTSKVLDPASGTVRRVEYRPTALLIHIQTQGPARPMTPWGTIRYQVQATLPGCTAYFELGVYSQPPDVASIRPVFASPNCGDLAPGQIHTSGVPPTLNGTVATMTFPLVEPGKHNVTQYIWAGARIAQPAALANASPPTRNVDETATGRDFTIGQDVPPDVECSEQPGYAGCEE